MVHLQICNKLCLLTLTHICLQINFSLSVNLRFDYLSNDFSIPIILV